MYEISSKGRPDYLLTAFCRRDSTGESMYVFGGGVECGCGRRRTYPKKIRPSQLLGIEKTRSGCINRMKYLTFASEVKDEFR